MGLLGVHDIRGLKSGLYRVYEGGLGFLKVLGGNMGMHSIRTFFFVVVGGCSVRLCERLLYAGVNLLSG